MQFYVPTRRDANTIAVYRRFNIKKSMDLFSDNGTMWSKMVGKK